VWISWKRGNFLCLCHKMSRSIYIVLHCSFIPSFHHFIIIEFLFIISAIVARIYMDTM
jgi:hypothetical protein